MTQLSRMKPGESFADYFYRISVEFVQMTEEEKSIPFIPPEPPTRQELREPQATEDDRS